MSHVRITTNALLATDGTVEIDGHDIASTVRGFRLDASVSEITRLELDVNVTEMATFEGDAVVSVDPEFAALLVAAGWTAPPGQLILRRHQAAEMGA